LLFLVHVAILWTW